MKASAQDYNGDSGRYDYGGGDTRFSDDNGVTVYAPRRAQRSTSTGAPIEWVSASRVVDFGDLNPNTGWGARQLRARIVNAARDACDELDNAYPVTADDSPPCVRNAVRNALDRVRDTSGIAGD